MAPVNVLMDTPSITSNHSEQFYNMSGKKRSVALIFNHETFTAKNGQVPLGPRPGTNVDSDNLKRELKRLGYKVEVYKDHSHKNVMAVLNKAAKKDHTDMSSIFIAILSHGDYGILHARDEQYRLEDVWNKFTADKCPTLSGKPKLFFIQACQGTDVDDGMTLYPRTYADSAELSFNTPMEPDFLIALSTMPGFFSWRNAEKGSWFIQELCSELELHATSMDLLSLLTNVSRRVATEFESKVLLNEPMHLKKQMPCIIFTLIRQLCFKPYLKDTHSLMCFKMHDLYLNK